MEDMVSNFLLNLNWTYAMCYTIAVYGIKNVEDLSWYNAIFENTKLNKFKVLILAILIFIIQCILEYFTEGVLTAPYISTLLRTWLTVSVFYTFILKKIHIK